MLVQDGARDHTAKETQTWLAAHAARRTVVQLLIYSPDYNLIEHVWRYVPTLQTSPPTGARQAASPTPARRPAAGAAAVRCLAPTGPGYATPVPDGAAAAATRP
jgi:hypothetical protein